MRVDVETFLGDLSKFRLDLMVNLVFDWNFDVKSGLWSDRAFFNRFEEVGLGSFLREVVPSPDSFSSGRSSFLSLFIYTDI